MLHLTHCSCNIWYENRWQGDLPWCLLHNPTGAFCVWVKTLQIELEQQWLFSFKWYFLIVFYYSIVDPPENVLLTTNATTNKACQSDVVSFTCSADAVPSAMSFQLFKDNVPMEISASGMWVKTLSEGGMFHYKCVANNSIGSASSTNINITVNGK